uniref:Transposase n=1 Tax=Gongylonema pulchrum TaxID=637853 RepID=A0A183EVU0_9BILA
LLPKKSPTDNDVLVEELAYQLHNHPHYHLHVPATEFDNPLSKTGTTNKTLSSAELQELLEYFDPLYPRKIGA